MWTQTWVVLVVVGITLIQARSIGDGAGKQDIIAGGTISGDKQNSSQSSIGTGAGGIVAGGTIGGDKPQTSSHIGDGAGKQDIVAGTVVDGTPKPVVGGIVATSNTNSTRNGTLIPGKSAALGSGAGAALPNKAITEETGFVGNDARTKDFYDSLDNGGGGVQAGSVDNTNPGSIGGAGAKTGAGNGDPTSPGNTIGNGASAFNDASSVIVSGAGTSNIGSGAGINGQKPNIGSGASTAEVDTAAIANALVNRPDPSIGNGAGVDQIGSGAGLTNNGAEPYSIGNGAGPMIVGGVVDDVMKQTPRPPTPHEIAIKISRNRTLVVGNVIPPAGSQPYVAGEVIPNKKPMEVGTVVG